MPKVGIGVIVIKDNMVLFHKRKGSHGEGTWSLPGGHLEMYESLEECAMRETMEETGISIKNVRFSTVTNDFFPDNEKHYLTVYMIAEHDSGEAVIKEPDKCECWQWFEWDNLPSPLFICIENLVKQNYNPFKQ